MRWVGLYVLFVLSGPGVFAQTAQHAIGRNKIQLSYFRTEFFENNQAFDPFTYAGMTGLSVAVSRSFRPASHASLELSSDFFWAGFYPIPEPFIAGHPAFKFIGTFGVYYCRNVLTLPKAMIKLKAGPRFRIGEENIYTYQYAWETNWLRNDLRDIGILVGVEYERPLIRNVHLAAECRYTRYLYRHIRGYPYDAVEPYNKGGTINTLDLLVGLGFRFGAAQ